MPWSTTFTNVWSTEVGMVAPPGLPNTMKRSPLRVTMVGAMDDSIRFPGAMEFAALPTNPKRFGVFVATLKSSISLFSTKPASPTTTPDP